MFLYATNLTISRQQLAASYELKLLMYPINTNLGLQKYNRVKTALTTTNSEFPA